MNNRIEELQDFYNKRDTKSKQKLDNHVLLERYITMHQLNQYIKKNNRIVEIGAGIRNYSIELSKKAKEIIAIDLFEQNVKSLNEQNIANLKAEIGDVVNLKNVEDNSFDLVLVNGPMSHLFNDKDRKTAIKETIRICKPNGYILYNYLTHTSILVRYGLLKNNLVKCKSKFTKNYSFKNIPKDIYSTYFINDFKDLFKGCKVKHISDISTDGIFEILKENTNNLSKEEFDIIKDWQLGVCERPDMQGLATHMLTIYKKQKEKTKHDK